MGRPSSIIRRDMDVVEKAQAAYKAKEETKQTHQDKLLAAEANDAIQQAIIGAAKAQIKHRDIHEPKVEIKNWPELATHTDIKSVADAVDALAEKIKPEKYDDQEVVNVLEEIRALVAAIPTKSPEMPDPVEEVTVKNQIDIKPLAKAINKLDIKPVFDPKITVSPTPITNKVDLKPVADAITGLKEDEKFDFDDYIAQDLEEEVDGVQHVLLVNPDGGWCIIENADSKLRYKFGTGDYEVAWANMDNHTYKRIDEAVREIKA